MKLAKVTQEHFRGLARACRSGLLALCIGSILSACASVHEGTNSLRITGEPALSRLTVLYAEPELKERGLLASERSEDLQKFGFYDLSTHLKDRVPRMLVRSGVRSEVRISKANEQVGIQNELLNQAEPFLALTIDRASVVRVGRSVQIKLAIKARLFRKGSPISVSPLVWEGDYQSLLGNDPYHGLLLTHIVNSEYVDLLLNKIFKDLEAKGLLRLAA
jgi:hypothetical protein